MTLVDLYIDVFAGLRKVHLELSPGLNVVVGPNEAGKSTVFQALHHLLFTQSRLGKRDMRRTVQRFFPVGGGDSIGARMTFDVTGGSYELRKRWGARPESALTLPGGAVVTSDEEVQSQLETLLPAGPGTVKSIFLTAQTSLPDTLRELREDKETLQSLGDLLRRSVLETAGISVERFREALEDRYKAYLSRWDSRRNRPENNRGLSNRWKRDAGLVVESWYRVEAARERLQEINGLERETERVRGELDEVEATIEEAERFRRTYAKAYEDAGRTALLNERFRNAERDVELLSGDQRKWFRMEEQRRYAERRISELNGNKDRLLAEERIAAENERHAELAKRYERAVKRKKRLDAAEEELTRETPVAMEAAAEAARIAGEAAVARGELDAGTLGVVIEAGEEAHLRYTAGRDDPAELDLSAGERKELLSAGQVRIDTGVVRITVRSGEGDRLELEDRHARLTTQLDTLLRTLGVRNAGEARRAAEAYRAAVSERNRCAELLHDELEGQSFDELAQQVEDRVDTAAARPLEVVRKELSDVERQLDAATNERDAAGETIEALIDAHADQEQLQKKLVAAAGRQESLNREITACAPLPKGYDSAERFRKEYERRADQIQTMRARASELRVEAARLEEKMPAESAEEAVRVLSDAEQEHERVRRKAAVVMRVRERTEELLSARSDSVYTDLHRRFVAYLSRFTGDRYSVNESHEGVPETLIRSEGGELPFELLSAGTKDVFALCLRLSAAHVFRDDRRAFLLLDDPLVDMDPERQRAASAMLTEEAERIQLVLFTCHPTHAALFGDARIVEL